MTAILAFSMENKVYMAGESGTSDSSIITPTLDPKIISIGEYLFGYAGVSGQGQMIMHNFEFPEITKGINIDKHMHTIFMPALRSFYKDNDISIDKEEDAADFLVGVRGRVYEISSYDFQCTSYTVSAIGSGREYALGAYYSLISIGKNTPHDICRVAIEAAITYSPTCCAPIHVLSK